MEKTEFNYYIHKTAEADYNKYFKQGLIDYDLSYRIESTMERISDEDIKNGLLEEKMKSLREHDETILLIKIPKDYFPVVVHRDGNMDVPIPLFYERETTDTMGRKGMYPILIPNLIQGCYSRKDGFVQNDIYCPVFDPSGLKFAYEQLAPIKNNRYDLWEQYNKRNSMGTLKTLYAHDKSMGTWDLFVQHYAIKYNVEPTLLFDEEQPSIGQQKK